MGLLNKRTFDKAKALAEKNKEKIASGVNKATDAIDKKTGGKHADKLKKLDDAAAKFAGTGEGDAAAAGSERAPTADASATDSNDSNDSNEV